MIERRLRQTPDSPMRRTADLVWAAGFFDGEGVVTLCRGRSGFALRVSNTNVWMLQRLQRLFGGSIRPMNNQRYNRRCRPAFVWTRSGAGGRLAGQALLPLLAEKGTQLELALTVRTGRRGRVVPVAEKRHRAYVEAELRRLKRVVSTLPAG